MSISALPPDSSWRGIGIVAGGPTAGSAALIAGIRGRPAPAQIIFPAPGNQSTQRRGSEFWESTRKRRARQKEARANQAQNKQARNRWPGTFVALSGKNRTTVGEGSWASSGNGRSTAGPARCEPAADSLCSKPSRRHAPPRTFAVDWGSCPPVISVDSGPQPNSITKSRKPKKRNEVFFELSSFRFS